MQSDRDQKRRELIKNSLQPLLAGYLGGSLALAEFKSQNDSLNKANSFWGFRGFKGQMFFNILTNVAMDPIDGISSARFDAALKAALAMPASDAAAKKQIVDFSDFVSQLGEQHIAAGNKKSGCPKIGSIPFFLSYFWQIQDLNKWPVYYTNSVNTMADMNLWQPGEDAAENYVAFKLMHEELGKLLTKASGREFGFYEVEHVFWFKGGNPLGGERPLNTATPKAEHEPKHEGSAPERLPESYVPPIIAILPRMALNEPALQTAAKNSGTSLDNAFEKSVNAAFTILGYTTQPLGQGQGRVPDGIAIDQDSSYAIIWDAKVRAEGYSIGTDDRKIREYVQTQTKKLKNRSLRNIYFAIISSSFKDDYDDPIRSLKMDTIIKEVCLIQADALVAMAEAKLRDPLQIDLGSTGLQRLFCNSGVLTGDMVREALA
ncbi:restriction endonuclease FokI C-terminal domain-containing protein [Humidesulfovibrio sp.]